jgi:hypothetical protein
VTPLIVKVRAASNQEWDSIWGNCDYATYFHSREWAEIWQAYTRGRINPEPKLVTFSDATQAILPLSVQRPCIPFPGSTRTYSSSAAGTFGGWIAEGHLTSEQTQALLDYMSNLNGNLVWRLNPFDRTLRRCVLENLQNDVTHVLDLTRGFDALLEMWAKKGNATPRKAGKARKDGVSIRQALTPEDWRCYYAVYQDSLKRWGESASSRYEWPLFNNVFRRHSSKIRLWLALYQGNIIAGALCFYARKHAVYWLGAALHTYFHFRPVNLLMYEVIRHACEERYQWFDFNPSGGHEGVTAFKRSFGAIAWPCPILVKTSLWGQYLLNVRRKLSGAIRRLGKVFS